jgi:hypothetical protein
VSAAGYTPERGERIGALLAEWKLPMAAAELGRRLVAGGHSEALLVVAEVLELEAAGRKERRVERLRRASKLPPGKTFATLDETRVPRTALLRVQELSRGDFVEQANRAAPSRVWRSRWHAYCQSPRTCGHTGWNCAGGSSRPIRTGKVPYEKSPNGSWWP